MDYINRELSWIDFNERVLTEACSTAVPLLERLKFIGIVSSNFDEFFMVRVAGLKELFKSGTEAIDAAGMTVEAQLAQIARKTHALFDIQEQALNTEILPNLKTCGLIYLKPEECTPAAQDFLKDYFYTHLYPLLKIEMLNNADDLADTVTNIQQHAGFLLQKKNECADSADELLALIQIPAVQRFVFLPEDIAPAHGTAFVLIDEMVRFFGPLLFRNYRITGTGIFKINRSASMTVDDSSDDGFIQALQEILLQRRYSFAVRMTCTYESPRLVRRMAALFELDQEEIYQSDAPIGLSSFSKIADIEGFNQLRNSKWHHTPLPFLKKKEPLWDHIKRKDIMLCVPYQSYKPVVRFVTDAAYDPDTVSIQMTLYRTSTGSPIVHALEKAAKNGKKVTVFVELKARFDEERNIQWVNRLLRHGVKVVYDLPHLKVHAKLMLVMRQEGDTMQGYAHLSTGNYNEITAKTYSDISLFTVRPDIIADTRIIFSRLCGKYSKEKLHTLITAPESLKDFLLNAIERERQQAVLHKPARIIAKMNNLSHPEIIAALYRASQDGVKIDLHIRGICMLIPQQPGLSDNIRVMSIIDRYLEHSRIFYFENGSSSKWYLSSADWMPRNLERRVELVFPVFDAKHQKTLQHFFDVYFADTMKSSQMQKDGSWIHCSAAGVPESGNRLRAQAALQQYFDADSQPVR
ncbi:MAG: polyphosphate kinase 1 [Treponema sp.]